MEWEAVIGLEVHVQLKTNSKIFSGASTAFGAAPNTQACAVDLGLPGVLPVLNKEAVTMAVKFGKAIGAKINQHSIFARKNYFYPDLPKGYQISQFEIPVVGEGHIDICVEGDSIKRIGVTRAHLEEDAGKSLHEDFHGMTGIDLNRAGTPLLEIVSDPDLRSAKEAVAYLKSIHAIVTYLDICDGDMSQGSMRCDANVSIRRKGAELFGTRAEIKNVNSFRFVERAINTEIERQIALLEDGHQIVQETRLYDADKNETRPMRSKEDSNDYRYFPDPDLLPVEITAELLAHVEQTMPELPAAKSERYQNTLGLSEYDAALLTSTKAQADFFEQVVAEVGEGNAKLAANWVIGEFSAAMNRDEVEWSNAPVSAAMLAQLLIRVLDNTISGKIAKDVFVAMWQGEGSADQIIEAKDLKVVNDSGALEAMIDDVLAKNPAQIAQYKEGKTKMLGFFVGQVMKLSKGKADPRQLNDLLKSKLDS